MISKTQSPTLDNRRTAHAVDSNAILALERLVPEQDPKHITQDPPILSTKHYYHTTTITTNDIRKL